MISTITVGSRSLHYVHNYNIKSKNSSIRLIFNQFDWSIWMPILFLLVVLVVLGNWIKFRPRLNLFSVLYVSNAANDLTLFLFQSRIPVHFLKAQKWSTFLIFFGFTQVTFIFITLIKTDVLTVDTSSIITNLNQIIYSINNLNFTACWIKSDIQVNKRRDDS